LGAAVVVVPLEAAVVVVPLVVVVESGQPHAFL